MLRLEGEPILNLSFNKNPQMIIIRARPLPALLPTVFWVQIVF